MTDFEPKQEKHILSTGMNIYSAKQQACLGVFIFGFCNW